MIGVLLRSELQLPRWRVDPLLKSIEQITGKRAEFIRVEPDGAGAASCGYLAGKDSTLLSRLRPSISRQM